MAFAATILYTYTYTFIFCNQRLNTRVIEKALVKGDAPLKLCCQPTSISLGLWLWCSLPTFQVFCKHLEQNLTAHSYVNYYGKIITMGKSIQFSKISAVGHTQLE